MIRFLLSLLALLSGLVVPDMAEARHYGACETEIGAAAELAREVAAPVCHAVSLPARPRPANAAPAALPRALAGEAPAPATVFIGIDRARA